MSALKGPDPGTSPRRLSPRLPSMWAQVRHQYADMDVGQAQIVSKSIPGAGRLPPCGSRHGQAGIPTPAPGQVAGLDVPVQGGKDKHYSPSQGHVRAGARLWQGRRRCAAVLSPPGRCVPSSGLSGGASGVVSPDMPVRRRCRLHVGRHILCRAAWQELCSLVYLGPSGGILVFSYPLGFHLVT